VHQDPLLLLEATQVDREFLPVPKDSNQKEKGKVIVLNHLAKITRPH
jgi:hypothetical protein